MTSSITKRRAKRIGAILLAKGITSRQELDREYDKGSGLEDVRGIGPRLADTLRWLRTVDDAQWVELTGLTQDEPVEDES